MLIEILFKMKISLELLKYSENDEVIFLKITTAPIFPNKEHLISYADFARMFFWK